MGDYFDRLVARVSDGPGPVTRVRPRLPHVFERPQLGADLDEFDLTEPAAGPQGSTQDKQTAPVPAPQQRHVPTPPRVPVPPWSPAPDHRQRQAPEREITRSTRIVTAVQRVVERIETPTAPLLVPRAVPEPPVPPPARPGPAGPLPSAGVAAPVRDSAGQRAEQPRLGQRHPDERRTQPPPAPRVVQVSIGRLEVSVAAAERPEPPRRPTRPAPVVSLERYLAGGEARS